MIHDQTKYQFIISLTRYIVRPSVKINVRFLVIFRCLPYAKSNIDTEVDALFSWINAFSGVNYVKRGTAYSRKCGKYYTAVSGGIGQPRDATGICLVDL